uniref:HNH endonuclease n=1 Tax=Candidatus Kentrum sp. TC TaxID=2126339 RepID=A0A450Z6T8_9GAMM|nr:MAG: hypothetical protein BECKTC1821D_GA0114238_10796 [Candidatus Kentron sp. TC]
MKNKYRSNRWIEFREELIELDGGACVRCGRRRDDGAVLQVHHKEYLKGKAPWEYPFGFFETLCRRCHAEEHGKIRPESGWEYVGEDDLGGLYGNCERCATEIRYVFFVQHPKWEPMAVGTICCDDLTGTKLASDKRKYDFCKHTYFFKKYSLSPQKTKFFSLPSPHHHSGFFQIFFLRTLPKFPKTALKYLFPSNPDTTPLPDTPEQSDAPFFPEEQSQYPLALIPRDHSPHTPLPQSLNAPLPGIFFPNRHPLIYRLTHSLRQMLEKISARPPTPRTRRHHRTKTSEPQTL